MLTLPQGHPGGSKPMSGEGGPAPAPGPMACDQDSRWKQYLEDERIALFLQNEEFMKELQRNRDFLLALERGRHQASLCKKRLTWTGTLVLRRHCAGCQQARHFVTCVSWALLGSCRSSRFQWGLGTPENPEEEGVPIEPPLLPCISVRAQH